MTLERKATAKVLGDQVGLFIIGAPLALGLTSDQADALGDELSNCTMRLRYEGWPPREGIAGPMFTSYGRNPHSWNVDLDDDAADDQPIGFNPHSGAEDPFAGDDDDGSGRPGAGMVAGAIAVWSGLQRGRPSVATVAAVFNLSPAMIREAVGDHPFLYLAEGDDDATTFVEHDGE